MAPVLRSSSYSPLKVSLPPLLSRPNAEPSSPSSRPSSHPLPQSPPIWSFPPLTQSVRVLSAPSLVPGSSEADRPVGALCSLDFVIASLPVEAVCPSDVAKCCSAPRSNLIHSPLAEPAKTTSLPSPSWASIICKDSMDAEMENSFFLFWFANELQMLECLKHGPWTFTGRPFFLKKWTPDLVLSKEDHNTFTIWVHLKEVPVQFWTPLGLSWIANAIGKPLHLDPATAKRDRLWIARICVEVKASADLPESIRIDIQIEYPWKL